MKQINSLTKKQLNKQNLSVYFQQRYGKQADLVISKQVENFKPLLQKNYGGENDCTLTSITAIIYYLTNFSFTPKWIYNQVEKISTKFLYSEEKGTFPFFINNIFNSCLKKFNINKRPKGNYGKDMGYNKKTIEKNINKNIPILLNIYNDGRDYYKDHTVTIIGYEKYSTGSKEHFYLMVYDNWNQNISYIDYSVLSLISSINYLN